MELTLATPASATDPVCGMSVDPATAKGSHQHNGKTYYFCSLSCRWGWSWPPARGDVAFCQQPGSPGCPQQSERVTSFLVLLVNALRTFFSQEAS